MRQFLFAAMPLLMSLGACDFPGGGHGDGKPSYYTYCDETGCYSCDSNGCDRTGGPTTCNFDYSGNLAEAVLLGNAAYRAAPGRRLAWNAAAMKFDDPAAQQLVSKEYRAGWKL